MRLCRRYMCDAINIVKWQIWRPCQMPLSSVGEQDSWRSTAAAAVSSSSYLHYLSPLHAVNVRLRGQWEINEDTMMETTASGSAAAAAAGGVDWTGVEIASLDVNVSTNCRRCCIQSCLHSSRARQPCLLSLHTHQSWNCRFLTVWRATIPRGIISARHSHTQSAFNVLSDSEPIGYFTIGVWKLE